MAPPPGEAPLPPDPHRLLGLLRAHDIDAALDAGLMAFRAEGADPTLAAEDLAVIVTTQQRLAAAWQARERFRARATRLARIERERAARRSPPLPSPSLKPALPAAAASALARARARAASRKP